jgi:NADPH2:quinone reductase
VAVARLSAMLSQQQLQHSIGARFSLNQIAHAHQMVEAGQAVGNVVVDL